MSLFPVDRPSSSGPARRSERRPTVRVVYIAGAGRSGTTLIADALGSLSGATSWGELRYVWERGILHGRWCGCGQAVTECPVWRDIFTRGSFDSDELPRLASRVVAEMEPLLRTKSAWRPLIPMSRPPDSILEPLSRLYGAVSDVADGRVIVDSSKLPSYAWLLSALPEIDLRVVSVVRDPRAVAHSWGRMKDLPDDVSGTGAMARLTPAHAAGVWMSQNILTDVTFRRLRVPQLRLRYEQFTNDPAAALRQLAAFAELPPDDLPVDEHRITLTATHSVAGNPDRFERDTVTEVVADTRWHSGMSSADRRLVTAMTAPLLPLYGYRWRP